MKRPEHALPIVTLAGVSAWAGERILFQDLSLQLARDRIGITGPNGSGKSTLVEVMAGEREPDRGRAICDASRIGYVSQNSTNWSSSESVIEHLMVHAGTLSADSAAQIVRAHRFPFALAERSLMSLSPGERLRAALICLSQRKPAPRY